MGRSKELLDKYNCVTPEDLEHLATLTHNTSERLLTICQEIQREEKGVVNSLTPSKQLGHLCTGMSAFQFETFRLRACAELETMTHDMMDEFMDLLLDTADIVLKEVRLVEERHA